ncbi:MAG TPA: PDZ domain-containing protein [Acidimicrobiia bacterium]|nr:PDZ domain-containing protein [Acidimicrobiia bacterium]
MDPFEQQPAPVVQRRRFPRWPFALAGMALLTGAAVLVLWPLKVPYYAMSPGPVEEVADLISVEDTQVYTTNGDLFLLTVGLREVNVFEYLEAQLDPRVDLVARDVIRPRGVTQEQATRTNLEDMDQSIDAAVYVALTRLGYEVGFTGEGVSVVEVAEGTPAEGVLQVGDVITHIEGRVVATADDAGTVIRTFQIGDTVNLSGTRAGEPLSVDITLIAHPDLEGAPMVGVALTTVNLDLDLPIDLEIDSRNIGGPSAGMMYAITVLDLLTPEDLVKGHRIAGTGTIHSDETVGAIGGVRQKVFAARSVGAEYIIVPADNYPDALTAAGDGIEIVAVATLQDALDFMDSLEPVGGVVAAS